mmetsp:Transcript_31408/g.89129  ORF Transcript_31408/g.89129 Transcript_31408/m.89129 type:complete len:949 (-) Transcript_31408:424-3270(-)
MIFSYRHVLLLLLSLLWASRCAVAEAEVAVTAGIHVHPENESPDHVSRPFRDQPRRSRQVDGNLGGAGGEVLFTLKVRTQAGAAPVEFIAYRGEDVLQKAADLAANIGFDDKDEALLLEAAKQYAQAAGALPLREFVYSLEGGQEARLAVYEGSKTEEIYQRLLDQGAAEAEAKELLRAILRTLREERLIPVVQTKVTVRGEEQTIAIFKDDEISGVVGSFAMKHKLQESDAAVLFEHMTAEAFRYRAIPMLVIPVSVPGSGVETKIKVYFGENLRERVAEFCARHSLQEPAMESLLDHSTRFAAKANFMPFIRFTPDFAGPQGNLLPDLQVWAKDNITQVVLDYADTHVLSDEQEGRILEAIMAKAKAMGIAPLLTVKITIKAIEGDEQVPAVFELFEGDDITSAVDSFAGYYNLTADGQASLLQRATQLAQAERLVPVLIVSQEMAMPNGSPVPVAVSLLDGDSPQAAATQAAKQAGLNETQTAAFTAAVVRQAQEKRLLPAVELAIDRAGRKPLVFQLYFGDNITQSVETFAADNALRSDDKAFLMQRASTEAMEAGLLPVLDIPLTVTVGTEAVLRHFQVFKGEDVETNVKAFVETYDLDDESMALFKEHVFSLAKQGRVLAALSLPVTIPAKQAGAAALRGTVEVFLGDSAAEAVQRLVSTQKWQLGEGLQARLVEQVNAAGVERRLYPIFELNATVPAGGAFPREGAIPVALYKGDNITELMASLTTAHQLTHEQAATVQANIHRQAVRARVVPLMSLPVDLESGRTEMLELFRGDNITEVVGAWGTRQQLSPQQVADLQVAVLRRAQGSRVVPVLSLPVDLKDHRGPEPAILEMYEGDNITLSVKQFSTSYALSAEDEEKLARDMYQVAVENRLLPEHELPVRAETSSGVKEMVFALFKGDDLREAAERFAADHSLSPAQIPELLQFLEQRIPTAASKDEL